MGAGRNFTDGQEIVVSDFVGISAAIERQLLQRIAFQLVQRQENAFFGDSFLVSYSSPTSVIVRRGVGLQTDLTKVSPDSRILQVHIPADQTVNLPTPNGSLNRIDLVVVQAAVAAEITGTRNFKDATTGTVTQQTLTLQNDWMATIQVVAGTPAASPVAPAVPAGFILLATMSVTAVSGLSGASAIVDNRILMPLGGNAAIDTSAFLSIPQNTSVPLSTVIKQFDTLLRMGNMAYLDLDEYDQTTTNIPNPAANKRRIFIDKNTGIAYQKNSAGQLNPLGGGGGGGGSIRWTAPQGVGALEDEENGDRVFFYENTFGQKIVAYMKIPTSYIVGRPINLYINAYSPGATLNWQLQTLVSLIRKNNDAVTSTAYQNQVSTGDLVNTVANQARLVQFTLAAAGAFGGLSAQPGDTLKVEISRIAAVSSANEDSNDIRLIPNSTEVTFT